MTATEQAKMILLLLSRSVAVAKKADRTAYDVRYICRTELSKMPPENFQTGTFRPLSFSLPAADEQYVYSNCGKMIHLTAKVSEELNRKLPSQEHDNFPPPTPTLSATTTASQTDGRATVS